MGGMSEASWIILGAAVAASTLIGTALAIADRAARRRAVHGTAAPSMPAAADGEPHCEATDDKRINTRRTA